MKKLNISSAIVGLVFGLVGGGFVYLFVPPPSTASAGDCDCPSRWTIRRDIKEIVKETSVHAYNCAEDCASSYDVKKLVRRYCQS